MDNFGSFPPKLVPGLALVPAIRFDRLLARAPTIVGEHSSGLLAVFLLDGPHSNPSPGLGCHGPAPSDDCDWCCLTAAAELRQRMILECTNGPALSIDSIID